MTNPIAEIAARLEAAGVSYAIIGAHAVNVWLEPRFTADIDVTVQAGTEEMTRLKGALVAHGFTVTREHGATLPSGPDFVRFTSPDSTIVVEVQAAKTDFQNEVVRRATTERGVRVATPEDLIVMKLIADRPKDAIDLAGLVRLPSLDLRRTLGRRVGSRRSLDAHALKRVWTASLRCRSSGQTG
jgi:hypothetical protein